MAWKNKPTNFALDVEKTGSDVVRKISEEMFQQVIVKSPVDTGAFRGNHRISINSPDGEYDLNHVDKVGGATQQEGSQKLLQIKLGDLVYIQNNLPYALALEQGHSQGQAPHGVYALSFRYVCEKYR
ncbi:hypothetical protein G4V72_04610 [Acinetobacter sp. GC2]|uniref:hypothetical protein n=1 Tax=Acinetobacter lwoffii TaxID=28090 RepID=UPI0013DEC41D|nr:hypothetical protein [Acinetobacter lwoffii]NGP41019.1 hypothetical protein [Acinetobacter lwoffii]